MKKVFLVLTSLLGYYALSQAQITNGQINYEMRADEFKQTCDNDWASNDDNEVRVTLGTDSNTGGTAAWNSAGSATCTGAYVRRWQTDAPSTVSAANTLLYSATGRANVSNSFTFNVQSWESDNGLNCTVQSGDDCRFGPNTYTSTFKSATKTGANWWGYSSTNGSADYVTGASGDVKIKTVWRYTQGNACGNALNFGTLTSGTTYTHDNTNRGVPANASASMGYSNVSGNGAPDVFYQFTISSPATVTISTSGGVTNYDTYLRLYNSTSCGTQIAFNDDIGGGITTSLITQDVCAGTYVVQVEGYGANTGDFTLTVQATNKPLVPGTIAGITNGGAICTGSDPGAFTSSADATGVGTITYQWESSTTSSSAGFSNAASTSNTFDPSTLTATTWFRRKATDGCGQTGYSNVIQVLVDQLPTLGTLSNAGPVNFCDAGGTFGAPLTVSGQTGAIAWDWGSNNGVWNVWLSGGSSAICCFPKKVSNSDGNADRARYRVTNGACPAVTSSTILIVNRYNEAPNQLSSSSTSYCAGTGPASITLTANFPAVINKNGLVAFYSGSCGGTLLGTVTAGDNAITASLNTPSPSTTTTYYARYEPGTGSGCSNTSCVSTTVTVNTLSTAPTGITGTTTICAGGSTTLTLSGGSAGTGATAQWFTGSCGGTLVGTGNSITVSPGSTTTYFVRYNGTCNTTTCASASVTVNTLSTAPTGITGTTTICAGGSTTLTLSGGSAGTGATVEWFAGSCGSTVIGTGNSITVSPGSTTTYYVRYAGTCNTTTCANTTVTVNALSTTPTSIAGTTSICNGSSTTLTSTGGTLGGDALDIWYSGSCGTEVFTQEWTTIPYTSSQTTINSIAGGVLNVTSTGGDPMIFMDAIGSFNPNTYRYIQLRYRVTAGTGGIAEIFFYNANHAFAVGGESATGALISDGAWHIMNIDMASDPDYTTGGNITGWRFDWANAAGVTMDIDFISLVDNQMLDAAPSITVSPTTSTTYYVNRRGACNTTTCASTTVTVNTFSTAPTGITGTTTICAGSSTTLTLSGGSAGSGATAQWFTGSCGGTLVGTGNSITVSPSSATTYFVRYNGTCNTTTCASTTVTVNTLSTAPTSITGTTTICAGGSTTLTLSGGSAGTGATAQWFAGSCGSTVIGTGNSITVSPGSTTTYFVRYAGTCNTTGCASTTVTVNTLSTAPTGITGVTTICAGGSTTLTLSGGSAGTGATVQWFTGSCGGTLVGTGNSITVSPSSTTTYFVRYAGTCNTTTCASTSVIVNTLSTAPTGITGVTTICAGGSTTLTVSGGSAGTGATAEWFAGSCGSALIGTGNSITVSPSSTTTYFVRYAGTCNTTTCASTSVTVNTLSTAPTGITGTTTICNGGSTTLTLSGGSAGSGATAQWYAGSCGGTLIGTGNSITVSPGSTTTYFVRYNGTCNTTTCTSTTVTVNTLSTAPTNITGALSICSVGGSTTLTLSGGSAGTGATVEWFAGSCGSTVIGTSNSITVSPSTNTTYYVRYNGTCNTTTCATATVTVGGTANVILAPTDQLAIVSTCDDGAWTYYESTTNPGKYVFAINWNANGGALGNSTQKAAAIVNINKSTSPIGTAPTATPVTFVSGGGSPGYYSCADASTSQATFAMQRYWNVNVGGGGLTEPVNVRFFFDPLEYDAVVNAANAWSLANGGYVEGPHWFKTVAAPDGVNNTWNPGTDMDALTVEHSGWVMDLNNQVAGYGFENGVRYVQFDGITSFSGGGLTVGVGNGTALPLDLIYFTGTREAEANRLEWATAQERSVSHFEVQRSSDAIHFNAIGAVSAIGNSTEEEVYHFIDATPLAGDNYYRMKMIDNDGSNTMSNIININRPVDQVSLVNLYPNPAKTTLNFELYAPSVEEVSIKVVDVLGREVCTKALNLQHGLNMSTVDVSQFSPGLYFLNVTCCGGKVMTYKFTCNSN